MWSWYLLFLWLLYYFAEIWLTSFWITLLRLCAWMGRFEDRNRFLHLIELIVDTFLHRKGRIISFDSLRYYRLLVNRYLSFSFSQLLILLWHFLLKLLKQIHLVFAQSCQLLNFFLQFFLIYYLFAQWIF